jgi:hypothetical protein
MRTSKDRQVQIDNKCYAKATKNGERTFTLVEHDVTSPRTILFWIMENFETASEAKLEDAFELAMEMQRSQFVTKRRAD